MKIIGVTGGIACGKSTLCNTLRELGAPVWDADASSRALTAPGGRALPAIRQAFGDTVFFSDGTLNRPKLGSIVFNNDAARQQLNGIVHPLVYEDMEAFLRENSGEQAVFLDVPLLFETGYDRRCDEVWCAWLPTQTQLERLMARD
ncbi:MAG: dephospho-CoA kinase, partial [Clostridia bacterium]|nr:dephospho-CoA kinase [Clostridia bacterium]